MRVLVTRPREDAESLAAELTRRGIEPVLEPLLSIEPQRNALPSLEDCRGLLLTSANGVRAFAETSGRRDLPVFAVGPATAASARSAGFSSIAVAEGDVVALALLVQKQVTAGDGWLLHVSGSDVAGDLAGSLSAAGYRVERCVLYKAVAAEGFSQAVEDQFRKGKISHVVLFSPRTAEIFNRLVRNAGLEPEMAKLTALCLSRAVADALKLPFAAVQVASTPDQEALLALLPNRTAGRRYLVPAVVIGLALAIGLGGWIIHRRSAQLADRAEPPVAATIAAPTPAPAPAASSTPVAPPPAPAAADTPAVLTDRLNALEKDVLRARRQIAALSQGPTSDDLAKRIEALEARLAGGLASGDAAAAHDEHATQLADRLARLEAAVDAPSKTTQSGLSESSKRAGFALAVAELADTLRRGHAYATILQTVRALDYPGAQKWTERLADGAEQGLPTLEDLAAQFPAVAREAKAASVAGENSGWIGVVKRFFARLVVIRRTDGNNPGSIDDALMEAQRHLADRDLSAALTALDAVTGPAQEVLAPWRDAARRSTSANEALEALSALAIGGLGGKAG